MDADISKGPDWDSRRREKLDAAGERRAGRRNTLLAMTAVLVVVLLLAASYVLMPRQAPAPVARPTGAGVSDYNDTLVSVPVSSVNQTARFYKWESYELNGTHKNIRFFAVMGSDGQVRTAFDNAYCCYHKDLGERQEGANIVCNMCQAAYPIDELNHGNLNATMVHQCCPADLPHTVSGKLVLIKKADLAVGSYLFK